MLPVLGHLVTNGNQTTTFKKKDNKELAESIPVNNLLPVSDTQVNLVFCYDRKSEAQGQLKLQHIKLQPRRKKKL